MLYRQDHSAARLAAIVESSDDAIISTDLEGIIASWNRAAERLFGYTADEVIGQPVSLLVFEDRRTEEPDILSRIRAGLANEHYETIRRHKDGSAVEISLTISAIRDSNGEIVGVSKIARDISERRRMERDALRLAAIVESSDDAVVSKDLNGIIQTWNRGAERIFGFTAEEAIGRSIRLIIPEDRLGEETQVLARICKGESVEHFETIRRRKDGGLIEISLTVSPIRSRSGEVIGASKIARDITEQKRLQRAVEEGSRAKDQFLAMLSHELRTPLNSVLGYTAMLRSEMLTGGQREKALEVIGRNAEALTQLVNDVLDTSRIVNGKLRLELDPCDVGTIAAEAIDAIQPAVNAKRLTLISAIGDRLMVLGDPYRLRQIFWNLLSNAAKFTPEEGRIAVTVEASGSSVRVAVEDTGIGLAPHALHQVFHRFWQVDSGETREQGGLGLGLALARQLVELHGGRISAHSAGLGLGATFEVLLPAFTQPAAR